MKPTLAEVVARIPGGSEDAVRPLYDAAWAQQCHYCCTQPYHPDLAEALMCRVENLWAARGHAFGMMDTSGDFGVQYAGYKDSRVETLEGPHRRIPVA